MLPGDTKTSLMPGLVIEVSLRNTTDQTHVGTLALSFPGFESPHDARGVDHTRQELRGKLNGIAVASTSQDGPHMMSYVLAAIDENKVRSGGSLGTDGEAWNSIDKQLPTVNTQDSGATLAADFRLEPGQHTVRRFVLAWHAPHWNAAGAPSAAMGHTFTHMYAKYYPSALDVARHLAEQHEHARHTRKQ